MTEHEQTLIPYLRVSTDSSGREKSPGEQLDDHRRDAETHGWTLGEPYRDVGSASRYARRAREGYDQLVADLQSGRLTSRHVLGLWEPSRGSRRVGEWASLVDALDDAGVRVWVHTHGRVYDPANSRDRRTLLEDAVDSEYESAKTSERLRRDAAALARDGRPTGKVPFGYERTYGIEHGRRVILEQRPHPTEAPLVRELYERILAGHTMRSIAEDWRARGVVGRTGRPFTQGHLRALALTPTYAGWRMHAPGQRGRRHLGMAGEITQGTWPALVSEADFYETHRMLTDPSRTTWRPGGARHWLSGIAVCDPCGTPLTVIEKRGRERYRCTRGCVIVTKDDLDEWVEAAVVEYLSRPDVHERMATRDADATAELAEVDAELSRLRMERDRAEAEEPSTLTEARMVAKLVDRISEQVGKLEQRRAELSTPSVLRGLVGEDAEQRWHGAPLEVRRTVAKVLFTPGLVGELRVVRSPVRGRSASPAHVSERVRWAR